MFRAKARFRVGPVLSTVVNRYLFASLDVSNSLNGVRIVVFVNGNQLHTCLVINICEYKISDVLPYLVCSGD